MARGGAVLVSQQQEFVFKGERLKCVNEGKKLMLYS
jgi:hypothetical protein